VIVTLENIFAFFLKHTQNFDWGILKQNYNDIPLYVMKKRLSLPEVLSKWVTCFFNCKNPLAPRSSATQIILMS